MADDFPKPAGKERFCWNCGQSMGWIANYAYERTDTCGARECEREARDQEQAERDDAHDQLDRDMG
jgi:hypothetical protein